MNMNKQELASKIWAGANELRGKVSASNYKDYMLGLIFYKFLSYKEETYLRTQLYFEDSDFASLTEIENDIVQNCQTNIGYFIANKDLFSFWINNGPAFQIADVRTALSAFNRLIGANHKKIYSGIFDTLEKGLDTLGTQDLERTKAVRRLITLINEIPVDGKQEYDVLGFVYEFLLKNFAANAGKAGEFYTPYEAATVMSEIISNHLREREQVKIYDPTSGSGSLLINIGKSISRHLDDPNSVQYYGQELIENTYNLTRMNLIMRGILPENIIIRNGDTLANDWPFFDDNDRDRTYDPVFVDACSSNPPYSQSWKNDDAATDVRFRDYGIAPSSKADYAFLLHNLYHLKPDGIMTIVLPHGTLFRGGEEGIIRQNLVDKDNIETIIGLPANCFFGTGIPTIIMVLKKQRSDNSILFVDASKGFTKDGNKNKLRAKDVRKIVDTVINRTSVDKFSRVVSKEEIIKNDYNLNIPRYVDSNEKENIHDIYSLICGGIPNYEIDELEEYWKAFPTLRKELFVEQTIPYSDVVNKDLKEVIENNVDVKAFINKFNTTFNVLPNYLKSELIEKILTIPINKEEAVLSQKIKELLSCIDLVDYYDAYQLLDNDWNVISLDLEYIQYEGMDSLRKVDPNMVIKKNSKTKEVSEVQEGWKGHILPFALVQETYFKADKDKFDKLKKDLESDELEKQSILEGFDPVDVEELLKEDSEDLDTDKIKKKTAEIKRQIEDGEIGEINQYLELLDMKAKKKEKINFINNCSFVKWDKVEKSKDETYSKKNVNNYLKDLFQSYDFGDEYKNSLLRIEILTNEISSLKKEIKELDAILVEETKAKIEGLSDDEALSLLEAKWISPLCSSLADLTNQVIESLIEKIKFLKNKYAITLNNTTSKIEESEAALSSMIDELGGSEFDMKGLEEFKKLLFGDKNE